MVSIPRPQRGMNVQVGDYVSRAGIYTKPGVVTEKRNDGSVIIDTTNEAIAKYHRHTNTSGLSIEQKEKFNLIMDEIMASPDPVERIEKLQVKIDILKNDKTDKNNKKIVQTLSNEQSQLIRMAKELPKVYIYDIEKLP